MARPLLVNRPEHHSANSNAEGESAGIFHIAGI